MPLPPNPPAVVARLCHQWLPLTKRLAHSFSRRVPPALLAHVGGEDELQGEAVVCLVRAATRYEPARGEFGTLLGTAVRNRLLNHLARHRRCKRNARVVRLDCWESLPAADEPVGRVTRALLEAALAALPEVERRALLLTVVEGLTLEGAGREMGLTLRQVQLRREKALKTLRGMVG